MPGRERAGQVGQACRGQLDLGRGTGPLALARHRAFAGGLALALDLALPVFVNNDLLFGILVMIGNPRK